MPSPFPGMDPFIEGQAWSDFHHGVIAVLQELLTPQVRPRYVVRVEERVYLQRAPLDPPGVIVPDVAVLETGAREALRQQGGGTAVAIQPVTLTVPMPEEIREAYLAVRERETMAVVAIIEVLSPSNKRRGSDGRREYLDKREAVLKSEAHLVEFDLLRSGERLPTIEPLPAGDYYAIVSRASRRPRVDVYAWSIHHPMPNIPVPLTGDDREVELGLQTAFSMAYDRAGYDYSLDYQCAVEPPLAHPDAAWAQQMLGEWACRRTFTSTE